MILGKNMHMEVVRHSADILTFIAQRTQKETKLLDLLWQASVGKHEAVQNAIYFAIIDLSPHLTLPDLDHMFEKIKCIPLKDYDNLTLELVHSFTEAAIKANESANVKKEKMVWSQYILGFNSR